jgi:hypothetical protein
MDMISSDEVIRRIETYFRGGAARYLTTSESEIAARTVSGDLRPPERGAEVVAT